MKDQTLEHSAEICTGVLSDVPSEVESENNLSDGSEIDFTRNRRTLPLPSDLDINEEDGVDRTIVILLLDTSENIQVIKESSVLDNELHIIQSIHSLAKIWASDHSEAEEEDAVQIAQSGTSSCTRRAPYGDPSMIHHCLEICGSIF
ncbi:hypothetical protein K0M31_012558 [Melipona bicolor]|uniref:Uncharacterized protein n=1 Tax=Melipona bicolor TaxID=60889 RepID=A0AA40FJE2_9HYME|nr:hypothetical protein K0M31_012558 [Melipona bicolor]